MKLSISVMAHPKRKEWAEELSKFIGCQIAWDTDNNVWNTRKKALLLAEKSDFHLVIQDDAILCKNFKEKAIDFIEKNNIKDMAIQFYYGNRIKEKKEIIEKAIKDGLMIRNHLSWGVAIATPTQWINDIIRFGNSYYAWQDDVKIKHFLISKRYKTIYPIPCLVDHRRQSVNPTLTPSIDRDRYSNYFIDNI